jgi:hypothetical protein
MRRGMTPLRHDVREYGGERCFHVCDEKHFLHHVLQGGAELTKNLFAFA